MIGRRRIFDADAHVIEPAHVFKSWTGARVPIDLPETTPVVPCGDFDLLQDQFESGFDAPSYARAMDKQGIDVAVLYPSIGLFVPFLPNLSASESADACRSYNEWIASYCAEAPGRLFGAGIIPLADPVAAEKEATHCAEAGLVAMMARPNFLYDRNLGEDAYDGLYATVAGSGMVLAVHEGLGLMNQPVIGANRFDSFAARHAISHPMEQMSALASLMLDGALQRNPTLRVAFLESGTGWLPYWLHRLDEHCEWMAETECDELELLPSEYFTRQCVISSEAGDALCASVIEAVGADHVMWASDFPHPDAIFPGAAHAFIENVGESASTDVVLWDTPVDFYGLKERV